MQQLDPAANDLPEEARPFQIVAINNTPAVEGNALELAGGNTVGLVSSSLMFTAGENPGVESFTYTIADASGRTADGLVTVTVTAPTGPVTLPDDVYAVEDVGGSVQMRHKKVVGSNRDVTIDLSITADGQYVAKFRFSNGKRGVAANLGGAIRLLDKDFGELGIVTANARVRDPLEDFPSFRTQIETKTRTGTIDIDRLRYAKFEFE